MALTEQRRASRWFRRCRQRCWATGCCLQTTHVRVWAVYVVMWGSRAGGRQPYPPPTGWTDAGTDIHRQTKAAKARSCLRMKKQTSRPRYWLIKWFNFYSCIPVWQKELWQRFQSSCAASRGLEFYGHCGSQTQHKVPRLTGPERGASVTRAAASRGVYSDPRSGGRGTTQLLWGGWR